MGVHRRAGPLHRLVVRLRRAWALALPPRNAAPDEGMGQGSDRRGHVRDRGVRPCRSSPSGTARWSPVRTRPRGSRSPPSAATRRGPPCASSPASSRDGDASAFEDGHPQGDRPHRWWPLRHRGDHQLAAVGRGAALHVRPPQRDPELDRRERRPRDGRGRSTATWPRAATARRARSPCATPTSPAWTPSASGSGMRGRRSSRGAPAPRASCTTRWRRRPAPS